MTLRCWWMKMNGLVGLHTFVSVSDWGVEQLCWFRTIKLLHICPSVICSAIHLQLELTSFVRSLAHVLDQPTASQCSEMTSLASVLWPVLSFWSLWWYSKESGVNCKKHCFPVTTSTHFQKNHSHRQNICTKYLVPWVLCCSIWVSFSLVYD